MIDPLSELDRITRPYAYAFDDPIRHTDPDGMFGEDPIEGFDQEGPSPKRAGAGALTVWTKTASGNTVGCCGEFRSANDLLLRNPSATPAQVNFTQAIRPRTSETVPMCDNCKIIFKKKN